MVAAKRIVVFEFVVVKNIIFNGLFFKAEEVFRSMKISP